MWKTLTLPGKENVMYLKNVSQTPDMFAYTDDDDDENMKQSVQFAYNRFAIRLDSMQL